MAWPPGPAPFAIADGKVVPALLQTSYGTTSIEQDNGALGTNYTTEYREIVSSATFFSESAWNALTGQNIDLPPGTCANVLDDEGAANISLVVM